METADPRRSGGDRDGPADHIGPYLVAVSGSGNSEYLIRWTSEAAKRFATSWVALHVRAPVDEADPEALERNLALARQLGAEVIHVSGEDVAHAVIRYARIKRARAIVIGKSAARNPTVRGAPGAMEAIIRESGDVDVIALRGGVLAAPPEPTRSGVPFRPRRSGVLVATGAIAGVTALGLAALPVLGYRAVSIVYLLVIIASSLWCERFTVLAGAVASALLWNFLFIPPTFTFSIGSLEDFLMFAAFFVAALSGGALTSRLREQEAALSAREERTALLYGFTQALTRVRGVDGAIELGSSWVAERYGGPVAVWLATASGAPSDAAHAPSDAAHAPSDAAHAPSDAAHAPSDAAHAPSDAAHAPSDAARGLGAARVYGGAEAGRTGRFSDAQARAAFDSDDCVEDGEGAIYLPLRSAEAVIGVLGVAARERRWLRGESRELLSTLAGNLALALERELLASENERHRLLDESARLSRVLLDHVSHELRTPLTTIKGSVSGLVEAEVDDDPELRAALLSVTLAAADALDTVVGNLLSMSRLESGALTLRRETVYLVELLGVAQASVAAELAGRTVSVAPACSDAELVADPALMVQVFRNVIRNFASYTPRGSTLAISSGRVGERIEIRFSDDGPGVPERELPSLFDTFFRGSNTHSSQGCGLGLSICRGIVEAHGGTVRAEAAPGSGLSIVISLPGKP